MTNLNKLGMIIAQEAEQQQISTIEIAQVLNCNAADVLELYKGKKFLSFVQLQAIAKILKIHVSELLCKARDTIGE
jgi:transcriptional regulator with XRE-family HTH domain